MSQRRNGIGKREVALPHILFNPFCVTPGGRSRRLHRLSRTWHRADSRKTLFEQFSTLCLIKVAYHHDHHVVDRIMPLEIGHDVRPFRTAYGLLETYDGPCVRMALVAE